MTRLRSILGVLVFAGALFHVSASAKSERWQVATMFGAVALWASGQLVEKKP